MRDLFLGRFVSVLVCTKLITWAEHVSYYKINVLGTTICMCVSWKIAVSRTVEWQLGDIPVFSEWEI
jgi:hypothetical protein